MKEIINTSNLTKLYGSTVAVDNVNLSVNKGEIFGFLGLNGAGKTTTIRMLLGMIAPTSGQCYLLGSRVSAGNTKIWEQVGYMVETPYSYPELTVRENLDIVRRLRGIKGKSCIDSIMKKLKIDSYEHRKVKHLSLGNGQRLGIAKALIHNPAILILDEPTNGLDPAGIVEIRELLQDLAQNYGVTILTSSHNLDEISRIATNIAIIHKGKLIREINGQQLEIELKKTLLVDGRNRTAIASILTKAGYKVYTPHNTTGLEASPLEVSSPHAVTFPEKVSTLLVNEGYPPTLIHVEKEDLQTYFLRTINEDGRDENDQFNYRCVRRV